MDDIFSTLELTIDEHIALVDFLSQQPLSSGLGSIYDALIAAETNDEDLYTVYEEEYEDEEEEYEDEEEESEEE